MNIPELNPENDNFDEVKAKAFLAQQELRNIEIPPTFDPSSDDYDVEIVTKFYSDISLWETAAMAHYLQISSNPKSKNSQQPHPTNNPPSSDNLSIRATTDLASLIAPLTEVSQINEFISQLKRIQDTLTWSEKQAVATAGMLMKGEFSFFFDDLNKVNLTLDTLRKNLLEAFVPQRSPGQILQDLVGCKQFPDETVYQFLKRVERAAKSYANSMGYWDGLRNPAVQPLALNTFREGARITFKRVLMEQEDQITNLEDAFKIATKYEKIEIATKPADEFFSAAVSIENRFRLPQRKTCYVCGNRNHDSSECWYRKDPDSEQVSEN